MLSFSKEGRKAGRQAGRKNFIRFLLLSASKTLTLIIFRFVLNYRRLFLLTYIEEYWCLIIIDTLAFDEQILAGINDTKAHLCVKHHASVRCVKHTIKRWTDWCLIQNPKHYIYPSKCIFALALRKLLLGVPQY